MPEICAKCKSPYAESHRYCPGCNTDVGFPNVRNAVKPEEREALNQRCFDAEISSKSRKCDAILIDFWQNVKNSKAVLNRSLSLVSSLTSEGVLYKTFYKSVRSEGRLPEENRYDKGRSSVDSTLFPLYHEEMSFAALSLDKSGLKRYGPFTIILKEEVIQHRATVFEENSWDFCQRHKIVAGNPIPPGYRAIWQNRNYLAAAKLHSEVHKSTPRTDFPKILLNQTGGADNFIEVHIYGPFNRHGIEKVVGPKPKKKADLVLWLSIKKKLEEVGATLEESI